MKKLFRFSPTTKRQIQRFKSIKRGYISFLIIMFVLFITLFAEVFVNSKALLVKHDGQYYFPTYGDVIPAKTFGQNLGTGDEETNYRLLQKQFKEDGGSNYVIMPLVPYGKKEFHRVEGKEWPLAPGDGHILGTDERGYDIVAQLLYGFRIAFLYSITVLVITYIVGVLLGCLMGFWGGLFDLLFQRVIEIWSNIPFLYAIMIVAALIGKSFGNLVMITVFFSWTGMTWYMRTSTYKEKSRDYIMAARALGASDWRIITKHILPNTLTLIITFAPFSLAAGITSLTALDFLGFGISAEYPSWGDLIKQGLEYMDDAYWIGSSVIICMTLILTLVTFVGEAVREAYDPKKHTFYE
ncbi:MAG: ABC transporter permease subunit [Lentisphaeraceae bacterium]|nr:ABC transporter permease subunit [Lentisphaeraceae bacterium]